VLPMRTVDNVTGVSAVSLDIQTVDLVIVMDDQTTVTISDVVLHVAILLEECIVKGVLMVSMETRGLVHHSPADSACALAVKAAAFSMVTLADLMLETTKSYVNVVLDTQVSAVSAVLKIISAIRWFLAERVSGARVTIISTTTCQEAVMQRPANV